MDHFERKIISIIDDNQLTQPELILKKTIGTTLKKLPLAIFREHKKQKENEDIDPLTNQSVGGLYRAKTLSESNPEDKLSSVYGGLFTVGEYFFRSFDASKGNFFERIIAAKDPNEVLDVDRPLKKLPQYILEPHLCWKRQFYTDATLEDDEEEKLEELANLTFNLKGDNAEAKADGVLLLESKNTLVFAEHRTSVVTGGTTARDSLFRKAEALIEELTSDNATVDFPEEIQERYELTSSSFRLIEFLKELNIDEVHFHIGILFNEERTPANWADDPQRVTSERLIRRFGNRLESLSTNREVQSIETDDPNMRVNAKIPINSASNSDTIDFHLSWMYGDIYVNSIYTGSLEAVGRSGELSNFDDVVSLRELIDDTEADDLWLGFSIAERENKVYELSSEETNNAIKMGNFILDDDHLSTQLHELSCLVENGEREDVEEKLDEYTQTVAERFCDSPMNPEYVREIYDGDPVNYLRDVAIEVVVYHILSRPLFLLRFPEIQENTRLAKARRTFQDYIFDIEADRSRQTIYKCIRHYSEYENSEENIPESSEDEIDWSKALTGSEVSTLLDKRSVTRQLNIMTDGNDNHPGQVLEKNGDKYAVPADIAYKTRPFLKNLPEQADEENLDRYENGDLRDFE